MRYLFDNAKYQAALALAYFLLPVLTICEPIFYWILG